MFLFSCFTGLSFSDIQTLTKANFGVTVDGEHYIRKEREKTGVESLVPLHPIAKEIALKQANKDESKLFSESYKYHQLSEALNAVGQACGIRQTLTFHMARHTFGTMALSAGVPMESIAKMMGHTTIKSTQIYAQITDQKISEDMDKLIAKRKEGKR